ncbi:MAG: hypothetical protein WC457_00105 [Patescibacteria group bacterium]
MNGLNLTNEVFFLVLLFFIVAGFAIGFAAIYFLTDTAKTKEPDDVYDYIMGLVVVGCVTAGALLFVSFASYCVEDLLPVVSFALGTGAATGLWAMVRKALAQGRPRPTEPTPPDSGQAHS